MVNVAEEVRDARRALPRAILITLAVTTLLYVAISSIAVVSVPPAELARSEAPLSLLYARGGGRPELLAGIAVLALANGGLIQIMKAARVLYGLAREGAAPALLGRVNPRTRTPLVATAAVTLCAGVFALVLPLDQLARLTSLVTLSTFALANAALIRLKLRESAAAGADPGDAAHVPLWIPLAGFAASLAFAGFEISRLARGWLS
jgi:amino acid transporter